MFAVEAWVHPGEWQIISPKFEIRGDAFRWGLAHEDSLHGIPCKVVEIEDSTLP